MWFLKVRKKKVDKLYTEHKETARQLIHSRLEHWAPLCGVSYKKVAIRNQRRSWGSCSSLGNLNFSYKLLFLPACMRDYIIVHELCHLKELNHSQKFWSEVESVMPEYKYFVRELRLMEKTKGTAVKTLHDSSKSHTCMYCDRC
jgi:predicted metal-dependent hydrolase